MESERSVLLPTPHHLLKFLIYVETKRVCMMAIRVIVKNKTNTEVFRDN